MARYRPIDSDMWLSRTIQDYDCLQRDVFFYYHTRRAATESGIYRVNLRQDGVIFRLPGEKEPIGGEKLEKVIESMPTNLIYDIEFSLIFAVQFLRHNGMKRGRPELVGKSVAADMRDYPDSRLWSGFVKTYPQYFELYRVNQSKVTEISKSLPESDAGQEVTETNILKDARAVFKVRTKYDNTLAILSYKNKSKNKRFYVREGGCGGERELITFPEGILDFENPALITAFSDFIQFRVKNGKAVSPETLIATARELNRLAGGIDAAAQLRILQYCLANQHLKICKEDLPARGKASSGEGPGRTSGRMEPSVKAPPGQRSEKQRRAAEKVVQKAVAASALTGRGVEVVAAMYAKEITPAGGEVPAAEEVLLKRAGDLVKWIETEWSYSRVRCRELLEKVGITDRDTLARIFAYLPAMVPDELEAKIEQAGGDGRPADERADLVLKCLMYGTPKAYSPAASHPMVEKAKQPAGITAEEYQSVPFLYRDRLMSTDGGKTYKWRG
jgi:hypothetical protein